MVLLLECSCRNLLASKNAEAGQETDKDLALHKNLAEVRSCWREREGIGTGEGSLDGRTVERRGGNERQALSSPAPLLLESRDSMYKPRRFSACEI